MVLDLPALEKWLWDAACTIRGPIDAPKYKNYILPLIFLKRLSDVFDDEVTHLASEFGDRETAAALVEQDHKLVRFYIPPISRWEIIAEKKWNELRKAKDKKAKGMSTTAKVLIGIATVGGIAALAGGGGGGGGSSAPASPAN